MLSPSSYKAQVAKCNWDSRAGNTSKHDTGNPHLLLKGTIAIVDEDPAYPPPRDHQVLAEPTT